MTGISQWKCTVEQLADVINTIGELGGIVQSTWEEQGYIFMTIEFKED